MSEVQDTGRVDLHTHTTASDGTFSSSDVVRMASDKGLSAVAITDHDTTIGLKEAISTGIERCIEVVPGIELSTKYIAENGQHVRVHVLGYFINPDYPELQETLTGIVQDRDERNLRIIDKMAQDGITVSYDEMKEQFGSVVGKPHFARILMERGVVQSGDEAFDRYLNKGKPYFVPRTSVPLQRCIELIVRSGGIAVIAHPLEDRIDRGICEELILKCREYGAEGIECIHSSHSDEDTQYLLDLANNHEMLVTGGSDFHGSAKPEVVLGKPLVKSDYLTKLRKAHDAASKNG